MTGVLVRCGNLLFRYRKMIFPPVLIGLFIWFRPFFLFGSRRVDAWTDALGLGVALAGQTLRAAVIGYAYIKRGGQSGKLYADGLVTDGLFRHSRNPLYVGNILILLGLLIIFDNPWVYLLGVPVILFVYRSIVAAEEAYLGARFGERYREYCRSVRRWIPDLRGLRQSISEMTFNWRRLIVKEYGSTCAWLSAALILLSYEAVVRSGYERERSHLMVLAMLQALVALAWGTARFLKKNRLLRYKGPQAAKRTERRLAGAAWGKS